MNTGTRRVVIYARVSTDEQSREGVSIDAQLARCQKWCDLHDAIVADTVIDAGVGGKTLQRDGFQRVRALVEAGDADTVLVTAIDRLSRSARDFANVVADFTEQGASIVAIGGGSSHPLDTSDMYGRLVAGIMSNIAEFEREMISERTRAALAQVRAEGRRIGRPPIGFTSREGRLIPVDRERLALARYAAVNHSRGRSYREIADRFNRDEVPTATGQGRWHPSAVGRLIRSWRLYVQMRGDERSDGF